MDNKALEGAGAGGIPEERARHDEQGIREGVVVMGVNPRNDEDADYRERQWTRHRNEQIYR